MKKWRTCSLPVILILLIKSSLCCQEIQFIKATHLQHYPSASTIAFLKNRLLVMGDDARYALVLDACHKPLDSFVLFEGTGSRISKEQKPDIEASAILKKKYWLLFSSFSTARRNTILKVNISNKQKSRFSSKSIFANATDLKVQETNIEGAAAIGKKVIVSNRANNTHKENLLVVLHNSTRKGFHNNHIIKLQLPASKNIIGVSGLEYIKEKDILMFSASTEETPNAYTDGAIGDSFLGFIYNISQKLDHAEIKVDSLINLSKIFGGKQPQKIESVAMESFHGKEAIIHLAADNDNGESTLFKARIIF